MRYICILILLELMIFGCAQNNKAVKESDPKIIEEENPDFYKTKFDDGIGFTARGNEPFWSIDIDFDKGMMFTSLTDISELNVPAVDVIKELDEDSTWYRSITEESEIIVKLVSEACIDDMSGEKFSHTVIVKTKRSVDNNYTEFKGCGKFLMDQKLHDIWVMQEMTGVEIRKENLLKGLPVFEIYLNDMRFAGHAGCNQLAGNIDIEGNKITFGEIIATKIACPDMDVEHAVLSALTNNTFKYQIDNLKLILISEKGIEISFKKTD